MKICDPESEFLYSDYDYLTKVTERHIYCGRYNFKANFVTSNHIDND
jgi:hypothetical protein